MVTVGGHICSSFNTAHLKLNQKSFGSRANLFCVIIEFVQFELHHHSSTYPNNEFHKARDTERSIPYPNGRSSEHLFRLRLTSDGSLPNNDHRLRTGPSMNHTAIGITSCTSSLNGLMNCRKHLDEDCQMKSQNLC